MFDENAFDRDAFSDQSFNFDDVPVVIVGGLAAAFLVFGWPWHTWKVH